MAGSHLGPKIDPSLLPSGSLAAASGSLAAASSEHYEYKIDKLPKGTLKEEILTHCNDLGKEGWRLVHVDTSEGIQLWFRRKK
jgi:hypothetical protein